MCKNAWKTKQTNLYVNISQKCVEICLSYSSFGASRMLAAMMKQQPQISVMFQVWELICQQVVKLIPSTTGADILHFSDLTDSAIKYLCWNLALEINIVESVMYFLFIFSVI